MTDYVVRDTQLTSVADAIRAKGGTSDPIAFPDGFVSAVNAIPTGGGGNTFETIVSMAQSGTCYENGVKSIPSYTFQSASHIFSATFAQCETIGEGAFSKCYYLKDVAFPECAEIESSAFYSCRSLAQISFPKCVSIGSSAFAYCSSLSYATFPECTTLQSGVFSFAGTSVFDFPNCTYLETSCFANNNIITTAIFPKVGIVRRDAFCSCTKLSLAVFTNCTKVSHNGFSNCNLYEATFPECTTINPHGFDHNIHLSSIYFPVVETVTAQAFTSCYELASATFPKCTLLAESVFAYCSALSIVSLPVIENIRNYVFQYCYGLLSLYMLGTSVPLLSQSAAFYLTPIAGYTTSTGGVSGSIFVRASLLTAFQSATNWSYYSERMVGLTDEEIAALDAQEGA